MEPSILFWLGVVGLVLLTLSVVFAAIVARFIIGVFRRQREMDRAFDAHWEERLKERNAFKREFDRRFRFNRAA